METTKAAHLYFQTDYNSCKCSEQLVYSLISYVRLIPVHFM